MRRPVALMASLLVSGGLVCLVSGNAWAQQHPAHVTGSGGAQQQGPNRHFSTVGHGMGVGRSEGGGVIALHGFLPGSTLSRDDEPPVIDVPDDVAATTEDNACSAVVRLPQVDVTDNRDPNPEVRLIVQTVPPEEVENGGELRLDIGSYDVLVVATDRSDNEARASFRLDVADNTPPLIRPVPNPTPVGDEAEADSPAGTAVRLNYNCVDACDPRPDADQDPSLVRYPLGDTNVTVTCTDSLGNQAQERVTVRVRDTTAPSVAQLPEVVDGECNQAGGAVYPVPDLVWSDNGSNADALTYSLIVDPDGENRVFDEMPEEVVLSRGAHVLRYVAVDESGNRGTTDLRVDIVDNGVPRIEVVDAPANGWHGGDGAVEVVLQITDGCSEIANVCPGNAGNDLDFEIVPPPADCQVNGNEVTLSYAQEGAYRLAIEIEDADGNRANDNTVAFGIDRNPPQAVVRVPTQLGVVEDDELTYPIFARAERLALNFGGEDESDGTPSGIANVTVVLDPNDPDEDRVVADHDFAGNGNPAQGQRVVGGVACENSIRGNVGGVVVRDRYCNQQLELDLREVPLGLHVLEVTVTDFAGNSSTADAWFFNADLHSGADLLIDRIGDVIVSGAAPAARGELVGASQALVRVRDLTELAIEDAPHDTPVFLGAGLSAAQTATIELVEAVDEAPAAPGGRIIEAMEILQRLGRSDVELMQAHTESLQRAGRPEFLRDAYDTDIDLADRALLAVDRAITGEQWNQAASNNSLAYFHVKSAHSEWMMDYDFVPIPNDEDAVFAEYERGRDILAAISDELGLYNTLNNPPATVQMRRIRDRLNAVVERLTTLVDDRFQGPGGGPGLTDEAYFDALVELREVANVSTEAGNRGAWVRNYQWSMMQVIRFMTQASVEDAIFTFGEQRGRWPIYARSRELIEHGVDLLDQRRVQSVIDLYGYDEDAICLVTAVYHCDFIRDEGEDDVDDPQPEDETPGFCWSRMWRPSEWADVDPIGRRPVWCEYAVDQDLR